MECAPLAGPAKSTLNFIHDEDGALPAGEFTSRSIKSLGNRTDPAFALNGFQQHGAHIICELPLQIFNDIQSPNSALQSRAWGAALVIVALILILNLIARAVSTRSRLT